MAQKSSGYFVRIQQKKKPQRIPRVPAAELLWTPSRCRQLLHVGSNGSRRTASERRPWPSSPARPGLLQQKHKVVRLLWVFAPSRIKTKNRILFSLNGLLNGAEQGSMCQTSRGREETPHEFLTNNNGRGSVGVVSPLYASVSLFIIKAAWRPAP